MVSGMGKCLQTDGSVQKQDQSGHHTNHESKGNNSIVIYIIAMLRKLVLLQRNIC